MKEKKKSYWFISYCILGLIIIILLTDIGCKINENDYERVRILIEEKNLERGSLKTKTNMLHKEFFPKRNDWEPTFCINACIQHFA